MIWIRGLVTEVKGNYLKLKTTSEEVDCYIRVGIKTKPKQGTKICCLGRYTTFNNNNYFSFKAFKEIEDSEEQTKPTKEEPRKAKEITKPVKQVEKNEFREVIKFLKNKSNAFRFISDAKKIEVEWVNEETGETISERVRINEDSLSFYQATFFAGDNKEIFYYYKCPEVYKKGGHFKSGLNKQDLSDKKWKELGSKWNLKTRVEIIEVERWYTNDGKKSKGSAKLEDLLNTNNPMLFDCFYPDKKFQDELRSVLAGKQIIKQDLLCCGGYVHYGQKGFKISKLRIVISK